MKKTSIVLLIMLLAVCTACAKVEPPVPATTSTITSATETQTHIPATTTQAPIPTEIAIPLPTEIPLPLLSLAYNTQEFTSPETFQAGLGDLDGDGDLDMVLANPMRNHAQVWLNNGAGGFTDSGQSLTQYGHGVALADFDEDGDLDAFIACHQSALPSKVYLNDGAGTLTDSGQAFADSNWSGVEVHTVDLNHDGHIDVHVSYYSNTGTPDHIYLNDGQAIFSDSGVLLDEDTIAWGDLDGDGDTDYFGKHWGEGYVVQINDGRGGFSTGWELADPLVTLGGIGLADFDGDGDLDALVVNGFRDTGSQPSQLFWNDGTGQFTDSGSLFNETTGADLVLGDLDLDGDLDVVLANMDRPNEVWLYNEGSFVDSGLRLGQDSDMSSMPMLGDLDGDGDLDIVFGRFRGGVEIWINQTIPSLPALYLGQVPPGSAIEVFAPGIVSIEDGKEYKITFSPDLQEIFFTRRTPNGRNDRIWFARLENGVLSTPKLAPFSYDCLESDPAFTPDGNRLYYNSRRPLPGETTSSSRANVWYVDRIEGGWSEPQFLGPPLNNYRPVYFSFVNDYTLYFTNSNPREIWYAEWVDGQYATPRALPEEINSLPNIAHPAIAPDESYIIVDSYIQQGGTLVGALYISFKLADGSWSEAVSLDEVLQASENDIYAAPRITPDGKYLFFESYIPTTDQADLYWVSTEIFDTLRP